MAQLSNLNPSFQTSLCDTGASPVHWLPAQFCPLEPLEEDRRFIGGTENLVLPVDALFASLLGQISLLGVGSRYQLNTL